MEGLREGRTQREQSDRQIDVIEGRTNMQVDVDIIILTKDSSKKRRKRMKELGEPSDPFCFRIFTLYIALNKLRYHNIILFINRNKQKQNNVSLREFPSSFTLKISRVWNNLRAEGTNRVNIFIMATRLRGTFINGGTSAHQHKSIKRIVIHAQLLGR